MLDTIAPTVDSFTITSAKPTTTKDITVSITESDGTGSGVAYWLVNESSAPPLPGNFISDVRITDFTLSTGDGEKTIYAWVMDEAENVGQAVVSETVILDTQTPVVNVFSVTSSDPTNFATVQVNIDDEDDGTGVQYWLIKEEDYNAPDAGDFSLTSRPTTFTLSGTGVRDLYVWVMDGVGRISSIETTSVEFVTAGYVAAGENYFAWSTDLASGNWRRQWVSFNANDIIYAEGKFVAVGNGGKVFYNSDNCAGDGEWSQTTAGAYDLNAIAHSGSYLLQWEIVDRFGIVVMEPAGAMFQLEV
jgi:hypothetical protein